MNSRSLELIKLLIAVAIISVWFFSTALKIAEQHVNSLVPALLGTSLLIASNIANNRNQALYSWLFIIPLPFFL